MNAVGFLIISNPKFFDEVVNSSSLEEASSNFVDRIVDDILNQILSKFDTTMNAKGWNTDRPPFFHVQTLGHVAGVTEYVPPRSLRRSREGEAIGTRDPSLWGSAVSSVLGVSIHPKYGGWFAYRLLIVVEGVSWPVDDPFMPIKFLSDDDKDAIIYEYNKNPDLGRWRDFNNRGVPIEKYDAAQFLYFHERSTEKRRRILQLLREERLPTALKHKD